MLVTCFPLSQIFQDEKHVTSYIYIPFVFFVDACTGAIDACTGATRTMRSPRKPVAEHEESDNSSLKRSDPRPQGGKQKQCTSSKISEKSNFTSYLDRFFYFCKIMFSDKL